MYTRTQGVTLADHDDDDKEHLLDHVARNSSRRNYPGALARGIAACLCAAGCWVAISACTSPSRLALNLQQAALNLQLAIGDGASFSPPPQCPVQPDPIIPALPFDVPSTFRIQAATRLSKAVQVPSINYDDSGPVADDPRWKPFYDLHRVIDESYPDLFSHPSVNLTIVNSLGRVVTMQGSDSSLKPLVLMAHQDAVPVSKETLSRWTYPPFAGVIDEREEFVWGRGAADCKSLLMAEYEALALLLQQGWKPRRTVILAQGYDEETSGLQGALKIAEYLEASYGKDSMLMVIDEGMESERFYGTAFALPATTEKGYLNVEIAVGTPGGHSSVPPSHTGIGILSEIVTAVEAGHYAAGFDGARDPILQFQLCAEKYTSKYPKAWRKLIKSKNWKGLAQAWANCDPSAKALVATTQAVTTIQGGVKVNALPELATVVVNHRIAFKSSVKEVQEHVAQIVRPLAKKHGLRLDAFGTNTTDLGSAYVQLSNFDHAIEPAPYAPTEGRVWDLFAGSIRHVLKDAENGDQPYIVSPFASTGNTDTEKMWNLTRSIYRYIGSPVATWDAHEHTVDEKMSIESHLAVIAWIHTIVQNADAFEGN